MRDSSDMADVPVRLADTAQAALRHAEAWLATALERAPALVLGVAFVMALVPLGILGGLLLRRRREGAADAAETETEADPAPGRGARSFPKTEVARWPADAWVEIGDDAKYWIGRRTVRIGRDDDNEIRLDVRTVHRHHAVIHRTEDADFVIKDLSSADGNGVMVNGKRVGEARLNNGDLVVLGDAVLKFHLQPA